MTKNHKSKNKVLKTYTSFVKKQGRHPTTAEMLDLGVSRNTIRHHYGSISNLKEIAKNEFPSVFDNIIDSSYFTDERFQDLLSKVKKHKRFVITTAVVGSDVHKKFLRSIENYCERMDALLLVLPSADPAKSSEWILDRVLSEKKINIVFKDLRLNSNFFISSIKTSAKQIEPTTGLNRIGSREGSFVFASPKQSLRYVAVSSIKFPHALMTTGAITIPDYETDRFMSERTAYIAGHDHVLGALIVEVKDDNEYHFRQIQAEPASGAFVDLGKYYKADGTVEKMEASAFILGDYHAGETELSAKQAWKEVVKEVGVKDLVIHDMFNGRSISHHDDKKHVKKAVKFYAGEMSLEDEAKITAREADELLSWVKTKKGKLIWVKSNHDDFLFRILEDGRYIKDPVNYVICSTLIEPMFLGQDPLRVLIEGKGGLKGKDRIIWLQRDQDYKIAGHECGAHGDLGSNGAKGSLNSMEEAYGSSISGHSHTPAIVRNTWRVGTSSKLKLDYNRGPSSWMNTSCLAYPNGARQLINSIEGKWKL